MECPASRSDPISESVLPLAGEAGATASTPQAKCNVRGPSGAVVVVAAPQLPSVEKFERAAQAIADAAATLVPGDTWASWKARFEPLCSDLAKNYVHLNVVAASSFNKPLNRNATDAVTQQLLDAATAADAAIGRPQIKCQVAHGP